MLRALHALYACGVRAPQAYDDLVAALLRDPTSSALLPPSTPASLGPGSHAAAPSATTTTATVAATAASAAAATAAATGSSAASSSAGHAGGLGTGGAGGSVAGRLSLWQLQSAYSILRAVGHADAHRFSQVGRARGGVRVHT